MTEEFAAKRQISIEHAVPELLELPEEDAVECVEIFQKAARRYNDTCHPSDVVKNSPKAIRMRRWLQVEPFITGTSHRS